MKAKKINEVITDVSNDYNYDQNNIQKRSGAYGVVNDEEIEEDCDEEVNEDRKLKGARHPAERFGRKKVKDVGDRLSGKGFQEDMKNMWLVKLKKDLEQNLYNLKKQGINFPGIELAIQDLLQILAEDYDM